MILNEIKKKKKKGDYKINVEQPSNTHWYYIVHVYNINLGRCGMSAFETNLIPSRHNL